ncbi:MAG: SpoIIE family protein phosphatase [Gemmataceae bacterium]
MANLEPVILIVTDRPDRDWPKEPGWSSHSAALDDAPVIHADVTIIDGRQNADAALAACQTHSAQRTDTPIIFLTSENKHQARALAIGADSCLFEPTPIELVAQVNALLRRADVTSQLRRKIEDADQTSKHLQQAYDQIKLDLEMAGRLQASFLPKALPQVGRVRFAVHYRPQGPVGGDFYDVVRLDERHVGFYLADVMGHGVPASLLALYLKRAIATKEISAQGYRIIPPDEVLKKLNKELMAAEIREQPFATMVYGIVDTHDGRITLSRAAHPYPLSIPAEGSVDFWKPRGTLLGVFESDFQTETRQLLPGDKLLLHTDGVSDDDGERNQALLAAVEQVNRLPVGDFVEGLAAHLLEDRKLRDDVTLLALEFTR